jgi:hypothetical protein
MSLYTRYEHGFFCVAWLKEAQAFFNEGLVYDMIRVGQINYRLFFAPIEDEL